MWAGSFGPPLGCCVGAWASGGPLGRSVAGGPTGPIDSRLGPFERATCWILSDSPPPRMTLLPSDMLNILAQVGKCSWNSDSSLSNAGFLSPKQVQMRPHLSSNRLPGRLSGNLWTFKKVFGRLPTHRIWCSVARWAGVTACIWCEYLKATLCYVFESGFKGSLKVGMGKR